MGEKVHIQEEKSPEKKLKFLKSINFKVLIVNNAE